MQRYFVYELIDPRDGNPFYVGKGCKDRPSQHIRQAASGVRSRKCAQIREILDSGASVKTQIVRRFEDEAEAYAYEAERIAELGLGNLTNVLPGGQGGCSRQKEARYPASFAKTIARSLIHIELYGRIVLLGRYDVTDAFNELARKVKNQWGEERFIERLAAHGVRLEVVSG